MRLSNGRNGLAILFAGAVGLPLGMVILIQSATMVTFAQTPSAAQTQELPVDKYDRNATLWASQRAGYESGWQHGQELYYMKCWMCHNEYTITTDKTGQAAPSLRDVAQRMTAQGIAERIRNGSPGMPAYTLMSESDIDDLATYLIEKCGTFELGGGCFDEHNPPPNPLYRAQ